LWALPNSLKLGMSFAQQVSKGLVSKYNQIPLLCSEIKVSVTFHDGIEFDPQLLSPPACLGNATLTKSTTPVFKHTINVVANCVSGIHAAKPLHKKAIVFRMPVADGCHYRRS